MMIQQHLSVEQPFELEAGGVLPRLDLVFHTSAGSPAGRRVVWICHALTANSDVEQWWPQMAGPGKFIDTDKDFVVCVNILGSPYGSSGPASINPKTGKAYLLDFPKITIRDIVHSFGFVRNHLGLSSIDLLIGSSIGGFQALEWAVAEPELIKSAVFMATAPRVSPWLSASAEAQRMALEADPTFRQAGDLHGGAAGLRCARAQALISYRSFEGYRLTQSEPDDDCLFAGRAASYERHQGDKLVARGFDAYSYLRLCDELDSHNLGRARGGVEAALSRIKAKSLVISITSDGLFPPEEGRQWAACIPGAQFKTIGSEFGHDGFLLETEQICKAISSFIG
ncbi:MAG: homoserine O-acetyltransferase [Candidatus Cryptobacteroides sp.]